MSQKVSRKSAVVNDEKEKKHADTPVKDMKKKIAANAEKEKQTTDKTEKTTTDKTEKSTEKLAEKPAEKTEKIAEKGEKSDKADKSADKKTEKNADKKVEAHQKKEDGSSKEDKHAKSEKEKPDPKTSKPKQNGRSHNGNDVTNGTPNTNGTSDVTNGISDANGTVSDSEDELLVVEDQDEVFPELTYDDSSDVDFEPADRTSRSYTRRSQVKSTRTPETPRPASDKQTDKEDDQKDTKLLKLKEDAPLTDRKLRSADSPKPQDGKKKTEKEQESPKKTQENKEGQIEKEDSKSGDNEEGKRTEEKKANNSFDVEVVVEVEPNDESQYRKLDTNYSKSRVKVSPYRRSLRTHDQTNTSLQANYTGNNTTMEMDITESSIVSEQLDDSCYLRGLRSIRGRSSYKPLKEMSLRNIAGNRSTRSTASGSAASPALDIHSRPTGTVVGRKRKPEHEQEQDQQLDSPLARKRMRVLETLAAPFRRVATALPAVARRHAEIVGINTDLPLTAPVVSTDNFDPETLKPPAELPIAVPLPTPEERDNKRCVVM